MTKEEKEKLVKKNIKKIVVIMIILAVVGVGFTFGERVLDNQLVWMSQQMGLQQVADDSTVYLNMKNQFAMFSMMRSVAWVLGAVGSMTLVVWGSLTIYKTRKIFKEEEKA